ncbi:ABC transporter substrate-binding protein [Vibrio galatheae]|uniref:ABC transporter substrate-binding protein n=1 Tax=Vibrio galatheae TaxID=579748 RepID=A0A0F4NRE1_9VIBR|nr:ABC transporter permease [Vibrio galatheae]KJY84671.1 ABC transporter substrate-binding protein [Vibrio galatheae]
MLIRLAWRNLWRQKRRTILTAFALALALFLSLLTRSFQEGSYNANIENSARFYTGLIQLQHPEFATSNSIDDVLPQTDAYIQAARNNPNVERILPRIESVALAGAGERSKGVMVLGVDPLKEDEYSRISAKLTEGRFLAADDNAVLVGESLAQYLSLAVGDELVLYGQGYRGQTAAGLYQVVGVLHFPLQQLDNQLVYMPIKAAQALYSTQELVSNWVIDVKDLSQLDNTAFELRQEYQPQAVVKDWQTLSPEMAQQILMDRTGGVFLVYVLYGIVGFGLFATVLMMTLERQREFGVMLATGLVRSRLATLILVESLFIAAIGVALGLTLSAPVLGYFYFNPIEITGEAAQLMLDSGFEPIVPVAIDSKLILAQVLNVLLIMALCLVYPLIRIAKLNVASALKGGAHAH